MIVAATKALASAGPVIKGTGSGLLPDVTDVREVSVQVAKNVIRAAQEDDLAEEKQIPTDDSELEEWIREQMWDAVYRPLKLVQEEDATPLAKGEAGVASGRRTANYRL
jgi:malate dehydrogenase (oxaloacetate-decarboxylating)